MSLEKIREIMAGRGQAPDKMIRVQEVLDKSKHPKSSGSGEVEGSDAEPAKKRRGFRRDKSA